ncbi:MAG TPA: HEAT repeat domain-containing protein [Thermodesulfovibrionales bacterium]|nr:HEAT repeat domain-containing protein [Thermodesulfovibrionales bacterium]
MNESVNIKSMIADYMEKGFLENIIDMFKHDKGLYPLIGGLMTDERTRVRLGMTSLVETLVKEDPDNISRAVLPIAELMKEENPTIRGDAAYLLGIIGHRDALPHLENALDDENPQVREIVRESIEEIEEKTVDST